MVNSVSVARRPHWSTCDGWDGALLVDGRFRVHTLLGADVAKLWVVGRLHEMLRLLRGARVVADEMQMLGVCGGVEGTRRRRPLVGGEFSFHRWLRPERLGALLESTII